MQENIVLIANKFILKKTIKYKNIQTSLVFNFMYKLNGIFLYCN